MLMQNCFFCPFVLFWVFFAGKLIRGAELPGSGLASTEQILRLRGPAAEWQNSNQHVPRIFKEQQLRRPYIHSVHTSAQLIIPLISLPTADESAAEGANSPRSITGPFGNSTGASWCMQSTSAGCELTVNECITIPGFIQHDYLTTGKHSQKCR